jgi:hypothetical protein
VFKMREGSRHAGRSRRGILALAVTAGCLGIMALPGGASASTVACSGSVKANDAIPGLEDGNGFDYRFFCNEPVLAYSIVSNRQIDYFGVTGDGEVGGEPNGESFSCEGPFQGSGFGCHGLSNPPARVVGQLGTSNDPCGRHAKGAGWKVWMTATVSESQNGGAPFTTSSEPFRLRGPGCKAPPKKTHKRRHGHH